MGMASSRNRIFYITWWLLFLGAALVRLWGLGSQSFWIDEIFSANIAKLPLGEIIDAIPPDKPPLDYYVQALMPRVGSTEFANRLHSVLAGLLIVAGVYWWAHLAFGPGVALLALALAAFNPMLIRYAQEARPYSLATAFATWQQVAFLMWWRRSAAADGPRRAAMWGWWLAMAVLGVLTLYTLYALFILILLQIAFVIAAPWVGPDRPLQGGLPQDDRGPLARPRLWFPAALYAAFVALMMLAYIPLTARSELVPANDYFWRFQETASEHFLRHLAEAMIGNGWPDAWPVFGCVAAVFYLAGVREGWQRSPQGALQVSLSGLGFFPATIIVYVLIDRYFAQRYTIFAVSGLCLLAALGLTGFSRWIAPRWRTLAICLAAGLYAVLALWGYWAMVPFKTDWRAASSYLAQHIEPGERVLVLTELGHICLDYYLHRYGRGEVNVDVIGDAENEVRDDESVWAVHLFYDDDRPKGNFYGLQVERIGAAPPAGRLEELTGAMGEPPTLWLGDCDTDLLGKGWSQAEAWSETFSIRWINWLHTHLWLPLAQGGAGTLSIELMPYGYPGAPPQTVAIAVAGQSFAMRELPADQFTTVQWAVPAGVIKAGYNRIDIELAWTRAPSEDARNYADFRKLGAAVHCVRWEAAR